MVYAIISDIHGNIEALEAVLSDIDNNHRIDQTLCLGDIVGYGANPNECIRRIREVCKPVEEIRHPIIKGNHDHAAVTGNVDNFNRFAAFAAIWTGKTLGDANARFLDALPLTTSFGEILLAHGTPHEPEQWHYVFDRRSALTAFQAMPESSRVCFIGHSHTPMSFSRSPGGDLALLRAADVFVEPDNEYLINVGSVGQPRDYDPRACYGLYYEDLNRFVLERVDYDIEKAQRKIIEAGLPDYLAVRLALGQ